ncbi:hypothetical protein HYPSUDRAFT_135753 [Hypholoma sublateritium FD-334 SS-4]|uniref:Protein kinase domain-containing protein n=1 Tax=Hypholoma sublateritium (strain FD-334 SS-4) TaxID=945553 RepID=A0A0D2LBY2_HYPSF|nr:hypothetical protein HYPSUDRAFT_135753 [Hypholoma sublateritium FD-334 SS-4]
MTVDMLTGNVTKIRVDKKEYEVVRHIYASIILFGRGTHVFLVWDKAGKCQILKDAWLLTDHGLSELVSLKAIIETIEKDLSDEAAAYRSSRAHPRFEAGAEFKNDSTKVRRGKLPNKPPTRVHRRVVTGSLGDPITSFRSRRELVQVLIDCVKWLDFLHNKVKLVHGDISITNLVIVRDPAPRVEPKGTGRRHLKAAVTEQAALDESMPTYGLVIDYDYARPIGTEMDKTSGTVPFMPLDALRSSNGKYIHEPRHDLESLVQTIICLMTFNDGTCRKRRSIIDYVPIARWYNEVDREQVFKDKLVDLKLLHETDVEGNFPAYWKPLAPTIFRLIKATWQDPLPKNIHATYIEILEDALKQLEPETADEYAAICLKRSRPSDLTDEGRYPEHYMKYRRSNDPSFQRIPRVAGLMEISRWQDSVDEL